jgi:hypothetical protein
MVPGSPTEPDEGQLGLFGEAKKVRRRSPDEPAPVDPVRTELAALDVDSLTPLEALNALAELKRKAGGR